MKDETKAPKLHALRQGMTLCGHLWTERPGSMENDMWVPALTTEVNTFLAHPHPCSDCYTKLLVLTRGRKNGHFPNSHSLWESLEEEDNN